MEKTKLEKIREKEFEEVKGKVKFIVNDITPVGIVSTEFYDLDKTLHKLKLDLITMAKHGGKIEVLVEEVL